MIDDLVVSPHSHPPVSGNRRRALSFGAIGLLLLGSAGLCMNALSRNNASAGWIPGVLVCVLLSVGALVLAVKDLRRPIQCGLDGRCRNRRIARAELRWHPSLPDVYEEQRLDVPRISSRGRQALTELLIGSATARLIVDDAPIRRGTRASMRFALTAARAEFDLGGLDFRFRCSTERPAVLARFSSPVARYDALEPVASGYDEEGLLVLEFDVPADLPGSDLLAAEPVYWEFTFVLDDGMSRYSGRFFVPVE